VHVIWDNNLDLSYGLNQIGDDDLKKNEDRIEYTGKLGYAIKNSKKWYYTALLNVKTQFANGYDYTNEDPIVISRFAAPAFTVFSLGIDYKPSEHLSAYISPISNKNTFVLDDVLSNHMEILRSAYEIFDGFNGKTILLVSDPLQIGPVVVNGTKNERLQAHSLYSVLWSKVTIFKLTINLRLAGALSTNSDANTIQQQHNATATLC
jgi:hypothetical protein